MAYRLQPGEAVPVGLRRIAREELSSAAGGLRQATARTRDDAIHEARKSVKKVRAILRLMRVELGRTYTVENRRLRNEACRLSVYRDATVMIETLDQLRDRGTDDRAGRALAVIRRGLLENKRRHQRGDRMTSAMRRVADALLAASSRVDRWRLVMDGPVALAPGLETAYRRGRSALADARRHPRPEYCHEWRKRVKDHWYHLRLLEERWNAAARAREKDLKALESWLGEHHNLEVLSTRLAAKAVRQRTPDAAKLCRGLIGEMQRELRHKALALGQRLYRERPELFRRRLLELWRPRRSGGAGPRPA
ncbi:MAG: CHAD domain-containing protein [Bryobacteraceae bacterium]|jgi:CHAD domain-containing protein